MSVPGQGLLDHISEVHVVFSNTDLLSIYMKQPSVPFFLTDPLNLQLYPLTFGNPSSDPQTYSLPL